MIYHHSSLASKTLIIIINLLFICINLFIKIMTKADFIMAY